MKPNMLNGRASFKGAFTPALLGPLKTDQGSFPTLFRTFCSGVNTTNADQTSGPRPTFWVGLGPLPNSSTVHFRSENKKTRSEPTPGCACVFGLQQVVMRPRRAHMFFGLPHAFAGVPKLETEHRKAWAALDTQYDFAALIKAQICRAGLQQQDSVFISISRSVLCVLLIISV